ncbi:endo alpha-1,4 polygalactosaminidase [Microbacterium thalli]|uniref:endo alpha-1,4 polygalactosaminidase n=1 Tax=Microbacterium thalli TaxID=3027921 RepID=UPI0023659198|nr:endo alpha-1,4 polygalactosaminidase [Microbacterium thalli]MDD7929869.1 endo alpha-1,4 polygalactosaminidase [Microbacterium thalli]
MTRSRTRRSAAHVATTLATGAMLVGLTALVGCSNIETDAAPPPVPDAGEVTADTSPAGAVVPPPAGARPDYQLGGAYEPAAGVGIVGRDREAEPAEGRYSICYVNGFQTQPNEQQLWEPDLMLTVAGEPLADPDWPDEILLDTSTTQKRDRILSRVEPWIRGCAEAGFDAVEFDNLDSFTRSEGLLDVEANLALASAFVGVAHDAGLAAGQKNAAEYAARLREEAGFDFAVVEECAAYAECGEYTAVYGDAVVDIEYTDNLPRSWSTICADPATPRSVVLRDRDLTVESDPQHIARHC